MRGKFQFSISISCGKTISFQLNAEKQCGRTMLTNFKIRDASLHRPFRNSTGNWGEFQIVTNR